MKQFANLFAATALTLASATAASITLAPATANAAVQTPGFPLVKGLPADNRAADMLAQLIEDSLKKDPHGNACVQPEVCNANGPRVTPRTYLEGIVKWHPKSGFDLSDESLKRLPMYIRSLHYAVVPGGKFLSSRMINVNNSWQLDLDSGFTRSLEPGEYAWYDTQTGEIIFLSNCGNIAKPAPVEEVAVSSSPCVAVKWNGDEGDEFYVGVMGAKSLPPSRCPRLQEAGDAAPRADLPQECATDRIVIIDGRRYRRHCSLDNDAAQVAELTSSDSVSTQLATSFVQKVSGQNVLYLPRVVSEKDGGYVVVVCRVRKDGTKYHAEGELYSGFTHGVATIGDQFWSLAGE